jgi:antitoxin (DNA-binding transcriptional repressor) of toxin-antitoxin stability system
MIIIKSNNHILQEEAMIKTITVTEAVRNFSELLDGIRYRGERYTIMRGGKPAATIGPAAGSVKERKLSDLQDIIRNLPRLEDDGEAFARDIAQAIMVRPPVGEGNPWAGL